MTDNIYNPVDVFNEIYDKYYDKILRFFKKDFSIDDAEDLTQQTFLQLWAWIPNAYAVKNSKALIFRIAKNVRIDRYKKNSITLENAIIPECFDLADSNNEINIVDIRLSLQKLSVKEQQLLYMKVQGYSSEEIGKSFGISASAARTRLQKIKGKINDYF
ncbi:MAG: RNA polymerase sigma factor [Eubacterium sp.]